MYVVVVKWYTDACHKINNSDLASSVIMNYGIQEFYFSVREFEFRNGYLFGKSRVQTVLNVCTH